MGVDMPISFMGYPQDDLVKMVYLWEQIEYAKRRDGFNLDKAIAKNYFENSYLEKARKEYDSSAWTGIKGEKKMTREEAVEILNNQVFGLVDTGQASRWVKVFEALGLIKFEEEKDPKILHMIPYGERFTVAIPTESAIKMLRSIGYKVAKD